MQLRSKKCVECGAAISSSDTVCPYCGAIQPSVTETRTFVSEDEPKKRRKSYLDGRSYLLQGEEVVGTFMPDREFRRRAFRSSFLASFIMLLFVTSFGILTGISGLGPLSALTVVLFVLTSIGVPLIISLPVSFLQIKKIFSVVYVITDKRVIIPQLRKKSGPVIMPIPDISRAVVVKSGRIKSEGQRQQYSVAFMPAGTTLFSSQSAPEVSFRDLFNSMRGSGRQASVRMLLTNSFRIISLDEAQKGLLMFNTLKKPATDKTAQ
ncbi:MAG: zinc ribbon domain-containing protein [Candidatus Thermoplasmatota archaeon]|nr:zinc ribbon domain-containing protein [Candidatus Thermoplasmatota archaeon]